MPFTVCPWNAPPYRKSLRRGKWLRGALLGWVLGAGGCAQLPTDLPTRPALKAPNIAATVTALTEPSLSHATPEPYDHWWQAFACPDLDRFIAGALKDHPDLATAQARLHTVEQTEQLARLATGIQYDTSASILQERLTKLGLFPPPIGGESFNQTDVTQNLSYTLDWWGKNRDLVRSAGNESQAQRFESAAARLTVAATVADAYFAWAGVGARLAAVRALQQQHRKEYDLHQARFDLGLDARQSLLDARAKLDADDERIHGLEYQEHAARYRMGVAIGADPDQTAALPTPTLPSHVPPLPAQLPLDWIALRPDISALHKRIEAAADQVAAARADFYPNIDLRTMVGLETLRLDTLFHAGALSASIGPSVHLPIFNTRTLRAKLGMQEADYAATVTEYNHAVLEAARQVVDAYALVLSLNQRYQARQQTLQNAQQARDLAQQRQRLGLNGLIETLEKDDLVRDQQMQNIAMQADHLRARVALFAALGGDATAQEKTP